MSTVRTSLSALLAFFTLGSGINVYAETRADYADYCTKAGGVAEKMTAEFLTPGRWVQGQSKSFCNFYLENAFVSIGLETFASNKPSIAATYSKRLKEVDVDSALWKGESSNPAHNVCKNLGGANIGFVTDGGFANHLGQSDICVFGDGSMVSGWSLIYMANHREGYDEIKSQVKAEPLNIHIPN
ncbi:hypothetical protein [Legionella oakridgensis]|uniref:Uncharacterized protein n=2 Tax=Legionella oakridgensis TaxID=29423 RepID=W0BHJ3_9GAMM|nr:hypothetical protein [Legionella oakridgensis]AHE67874.1 hypothetical protein Loa_02332 [Legionella oakridgensis ATCC 33761 = DSM 21215]ETO92508.1 hypothetical protein LOR_63c15940 [Legionella oakridgensis RV-2-2007]KTD38697.1 hypothetical protein Loak_1185 [Legionella oakridgensis]STY20881.1 Uncharacterised protein [Legionella longbeachae]